MNTLAPLRLTAIAAALLLTLGQGAYAQRATAPQGPPNPGTPIVIDEAQGVATASGRQTQVFSTILHPDPNDPEHATDPKTGRNFNWDHDKKAWVNSQTGQTVNFVGYLSSNGSPGASFVIDEAQGVATASGRQTQVFSTILHPDPNDPEHATDPKTGRNFHWDPDMKQWVNSQTGESVNFVGYLTGSPAPSSPPTPGTTGTAPSSGATPQEKKTVSMSGFTPIIQIRGFGGATFVNGNTPATAGFDGAVLFPLGNRVLVGPTAGFQWIDSSIIKTIGGGPPPSTFINTSVGFKSGNFGGRIGFPFGGWEIGIHGGATVAGSTITQVTGFCGGTTSTGGTTTGCTTTSSTTTHDTVVGPFVGGYVSHNIFSDVGFFVEAHYLSIKDGKVFDLHYCAALGGLVVSFGRH